MPCLLGRLDGSSWPPLSLGCPPQSAMPMRPHRCSSTDSRPPSIHSTGRLAQSGRLLALLVSASPLAQTNHIATPSRPPHPISRYLYGPAVCSLTLARWLAPLIGCFHFSLLASFSKRGMRGFAYLLASCGRSPRCGGFFFFFCLVRIFSGHFGASVGVACESQLREKRCYQRRIGQVVG